jgi:hypothetical protein
MFPRLPISLLIISMNDSDFIIPKIKSKSITMITYHQHKLEKIMN